MTLVVVLTLMLVTGLGLLIDRLKASPPYRQALAAARAEPQRLLGTPIEDGWLPSGSFALDPASAAEPPR